jgi:hypothetical protein
MTNNICVYEDTSLKGAATYTHNLGKITDWVKLS